MSDASARKIIPKEILATAERQTGIPSREKIILEVQLEGQALLQQTIEANAASTELLTKKLGVFSLILSVVTLLVTVVGVYVSYRALYK